MNTAENKRLKQVFDTLDWTSLQQPVLAISGESFEKSKKFFKPYIHASMLYKFPEDRKRS